MTNKEIMRAQLKKYVFSNLMEKGFVGKYPHFRKVCDHSIELITFQTNKWGGSFLVEVSAVFPNVQDKNYREREGLNEEDLTVWDTNSRYRLKGMYDGWFYYRDVYVEHTLFFGKLYHDVREKDAPDFVPPKKYRLVQKFDEQTAIAICAEVNKQLEDGFRWLVKFENRNK